jgi:hypothetical protein
VNEQARGDEPLEPRVRRALRRHERMFARRGPRAGAPNQVAERRRTTRSAILLPLLLPI